MEIDNVRAYLTDTYPDTHVLEGNGDLFFLHDPRKDLPAARQMPWATLVNSDVNDTASDLDRPGVYRLNIGIPKADFRALFPVPGEHDLTALDVLLPHPVYAAQYWICVLNPTTTWPTVRTLLDVAHARAVRRYDAAEARSQPR